jgi:transposase-like protein
MGKSKGTRYSDEEREELVELYRQSGYSVSRFCREMELSHATLKRWLGRSPARACFVEVSADSLSRVSASLVARLPNGISLELGCASREEAIGWIRELKRC